MPRGPLGFPRLTSIGPLVTDGGQREPEVGIAAMWTDDSGDFDGLKYGSVVVPTQIKDGSITFKMANKPGRWTVDKEKFIKKTEEV